MSASAIPPRPVPTGRGVPSPPASTIAGDARAVSELVAHCRLSGDAIEALAGQLDGVDRLGGEGSFRIVCERSRRELCLSLAAADWRRLALAKARIAGEIRRMPGCADLALT